VSLLILACNFFIKCLMYAMRKLGTKE
jgi:hypothetical protein